MADQASETDNVNTDSAVVNADSANVLNVLMDAVGGVGDFITGVDTSKTDGKSTVSGAEGFIDNTQLMSGEDIGRLADSTLTKLTSSDYVQQQVANSISNLLGTGDVDMRGDDPQGYDDYYGYGGDYQPPRSGSCEVEYNANYEGTVLNANELSTAQTAAGCCELCQQHEECNVWVYCGEQTGCGAPHYEFGQCYLKRQEFPRSRKAYERGEGVYWTSGIVVGGDGIIAKSYSQAAQDMSREVLYVSGVPATWTFDGEELDPNAPMTPKRVQCGSYNTIRGVATYNKDFNMRLEAPQATSGGLVVLLWSDVEGRSALPAKFRGSSCGQLPLSMGQPSGSLSSQANADGIAEFIVDGVNKSSGQCSKFIYQYVDLGTCKVSAVLDTRSGGSGQQTARAASGSAAWQG